MKKLSSVHQFDHRKFRMGSNVLLIQITNSSLAYIFSLPIRTVSLKILIKPSASGHLINGLGGIIRVDAKLPMDN